MTAASTRSRMSGTMPRDDEDSVNGHISFASARSTQADRLAASIPHLAEQVERAGADGHLVGAGPVFVGIGASLAAAAAPVWQLRARGIDAWRLGAGDTPLPLPWGEHPIVAISQSGRSTETIAALDSVDGSRRFAVVNSRPSPLAGLVEHPFELGNIPDSYASTIGYTATVAALSLIAESWDGGVIDASWSTLPERFREFDDRLGAVVERAARFFVEAPYGDFVGGGASVGSAEAGALLFREVARVPSSAMSTRQYLHGAMESAGAGVHVLFGGGREAEVARMLTEAGHRVVLVTEEAVAEDEHLSVVIVPAASVGQRSVLESLVMQVLVERVARSRGVEIEEFVFHNEDTKVDAQAGA